jgi:hypothetical protein
LTFSELSAIGDFPRVRGELGNIVISINSRKLRHPQSIVPAPLWVF